MYNTYRFKNGKKLKKNKVVRKIALGATALAIALGAYSYGARNTKEGKIVNPFFGPSISSTMLDETGEEYISLLKQTKNATQREAMEHASFLMDNFNTRFANAYIEEGKDIKPALTWDEIMALNLAYNDYSKEEIAAIFNGADLDATELSHAYRNGTLQLMGAYVIADREYPVNSYLFLRNEEHQNFVKKYEDLFYNCKEATTEEAMIAAVNTFYAELYKDFPIEDEVREYGISHGEARRELQPHKLAVTPIVAASEIMFQNLAIDHTLSDKAIAYFNDLGLCNMADQAFEKAMYISLATEEDKRNPSYIEFKTTKIEELIEEDSYGVADAERDLSQLDRFKYWVNGGYFERFGDRYIVTTHTVTSTTTWKERHETRTDDRDEAVRRAGEEAVKKAQAQKSPLPCGCPGTNSKVIKRETASAVENEIKPVSRLSQWPVQIKLVPVNAPYFDGANLLVAADCTAYAYANFHNDFIKNKITLIGCPKLDSVDYSEKLTQIIANNEIKSVTVVRMEVPCCGGIENAVKTALMQSGKFIPWQVVTISTDGKILD